MSIVYARKDHTAVVSPIGEIDLSSAPQLEAALARARRSTNLVRVDFSRCTFIDSSGLRVILATARDLQVAGGELSISGLLGGVEKLFSITGLLLEGSPIHVDAEARGQAA